MSNHDDHAAGAAGDHGAHGPEVAAESSPVDVDRPTPLSAFIWPGLIALLVLILIWRPVTSAFSAYSGNTNGPPPATVVPAETPPIEATLAASTPITGSAQTVIPQPTNALTALPTNVQGGGLVTPTTALTATVAPVTDTPLPTATAVPPTETAAPPTETAAPPTDTAIPLVPTDTAVPPTPTETVAPGAVLPLTAADLKQGAPKSIAFAGKTFPVTTSNTTLPDWAFSKDPGVANWVSGTIVNYILGISYSPANANLFASVRGGDSIRLTRADGAVYAFAVDLIARIAPTNVKALEQDHPAVTLLLLGDPAPNRVVIQGHYVQAAAP